MLIVTLLISFIISFILFPAMIIRLKKAGIVGKNMNSEKQEEVAEMGGLVIVAGFGVGIFMVIAAKTFSEEDFLHSHEFISRILKYGDIKNWVWVIKKFMIENCCKYFEQNS